MIGKIFSAMIITSVTGTLAALLVLLIKPLTSRFLAKPLNYYLWLSVIIILILPVRIDILPSNSSKVITDYIYTKQEYPQSGDVKTLPDNSDTYSKAFTKRGTFEVLANIWLMTAAISFLYKVISHILYIKNLMKSSKIIDRQGNVDIHQCRAADTPFASGILRKRIFLPDIPLNEIQLTNIISHEMTHLKRNDILIKWFANAVKSIHWFNPMMYIIFSELCTECEISCDFEVTKAMTDREKTSYIATILDLISHRHQRCFTTQMANSKQKLIRRFTMIKTNKKTSKTAIAVSVAILAAIFSIGIVISGVTANEVLPVGVPGGAENSANENAEENFAFPLKDRKEISSPFGTRVHPITNEEITHSGIDIRAEKGTGILAAKSGTVTEAAFDTTKGNYVIIDHGKSKTLYSQMDSISVSTGEKISQGQIIGTVGSTGNSTGPHLHFEIHIDGIAQNPVNYLN